MLLTAAVPHRSATPSMATCNSAKAALSYTNRGILCELLTRSLDTSYSSYSSKRHPANQYCQIAEQRRLGHLSLKRQC